MTNLRKRTDDHLSSLAAKLNEGIKIGAEKGKIEEKIEVAKNSLKVGISVDIVVQMTGLSVDEIKQLQKEKTL